MRFPCRNLFRTVVVLLVSTVSIAPVRSAQPTLMGRWGDEWMPQQLTYEYRSKKNRALVVVALSTNCPLARRIIPTLNRLQAEYDAEGVQFIGLFPNGLDDLRAIAEYAVDTELAFPVYRDDPDEPWHRVLGLTTTPQVAILDVTQGFTAAKIVYRGQVDGRWAGGGSTAAGRDYLADALRSMLAGSEPRLRETAASGCRIAATAMRDERQWENVTYYGEISRLVERRCLSCHRDGEAGASQFAAFDSYDAVASMCDIMLSRIENRIMPPWDGSTDPVSSGGGFKHDLRLSDDEIARFRAWVAAGCRAGDRSDAPPPRDWPGSDDWLIGSPDLVFVMPEPYVVPRDRLDEYQYYRIGADFTRDRYIQAIEMKPGNLAVVHHMGAVVGPASAGDISANEALLKLYGLIGDKVKKIGDYVAGDPFNARTYPPGYALKLPAGHDIFFEMHYTPTGLEEEPDVSRMAVKWADAPPQHIVDTKVFTRKDLRIRPHNLHYEKRTFYQFSTDVLIFALAPHMHNRGKDFVLYKIENMGSSTERRMLVLKIPAYDVNWQRTYEFAHPIPLKAGDALYSIAHFDNSHYHPFNPDPESFVRFGLKSTDEMLNMRVKFERVNLDDPINAQQDERGD